MKRWTLTMDPRPTETRVLMMDGRDERLRAILGPARTAHPRAAETLLEGLALWHQHALSVVLCADVDAPESTSVLHLEDALGFGVRNVHFDVEVALRGSRVARRRPRRLSTMGSFGDLRQLCLEGVEP